MGGIFLVLTAVSGFWFAPSWTTPPKTRCSGRPWRPSSCSSSASRSWGDAGQLVRIRLERRALVFVVILLSGTMAGAIYNIAIPTLVPLIVPEDRRDRANGMFGTTIGIAFALTSVASGISLAFGGMTFVLLAAVIATALAIVLLALIPIPEREILARPEGGAPPERPGKDKRIDIAGTIRAVKAVPGLFALIFFTTFNNFLGGVFMALMDAYGLSLVSVQVWERSGAS